MKTPDHTRPPGGDEFPETAPGRCYLVHLGTSTDDEALAAVSLTFSEADRIMQEAVQSTGWRVHGTIADYPFEGPAEALSDGTNVFILIEPDGSGEHGFHVYASRADAVEALDGMADDEPGVQLREVKLNSMLISTAVRFPPQGLSTPERNELSKSIGSQT